MSFIGIYIYTFIYWALITDLYNEVLVIVWQIQEQITN